MNSYTACAITPHTVKELFELCLHNAGLRAGICYLEHHQYTLIRDMLRDIEAEELPWCIDRTLLHSDGFKLCFYNDSTLDVFMANNGTRGQRLHYLIVDEAIDESIQTTILRPLIRCYRDTVIDNDVKDLFKFAEAALQSPLCSWQKDMLTCLYNNTTYIAGRTSGKQTIYNIYTEWIDLRRLIAIDDTTVLSEPEYTYEQLMSGVSINNACECAIK